MHLYQCQIHRANGMTRGRITEVMNTLVTMGATLIRGHTLGVSVGNPLSMMPALDVFNEAAFKTMDWAVSEAGQKGLKIMAPLIDNYVCQLPLDQRIKRASLAGSSFNTRASANHI